MQVIIHGDNLVSSRQKLSQLAKNSQETIRLDGKKINITTLKQALESQSIFGKNKLVIIENLPTKLINYLSQISNSNLIIWNSKSLAKTTLNKLKNFESLLFKTPPAIFKFLDSLKPGNCKLTLTILHSNLKNQPGELIFYMLSRRLSQLIMAADQKANHLLKAAPWQKSRLISQAKTFPLNKLLSLHHQLVKIDYNIKTGNSVLPLSGHLDLFLAKL